MTDERVKVILGGLLHDVGKVVYRTGGNENHSILGSLWLEKEAKLQDEDVLEQIRYHHKKELAQAKVKNDSLAYITYIADNIASGLDRREENGQFGYEQGVPLESIFNHMNGNSEEKYYPPGFLDSDSRIAYPEDKKIPYSSGFYQSVLAQLKGSLAGITYEEDYIESFLEVLEGVFNFIPSSTSKKERGDISLYDHSKLTAAVGSCIHEYLSEQDRKNYKMELLENRRNFYNEQVFYLYSMDISGIQDFIYTTASDKVLKALRVRSFYLEILMEHCIDQLLFKLELSRCNLLYSGGGHAYLLFPATERVKEYLENFEKQVNKWFLERFKVSLFLGTGYVKCTANTLMNIPDKSYKKMFRDVSKMISDKKIHRYDSADLIWLNRYSAGEQHSRECKVCHRTDLLTKEDKCIFCSQIEKMSSQLLKKSYFVVTYGESENSLPLPFGCSLKILNKEDTIKEMKKTDYVKTYGKNQIHTGLHVTKLWVGDYSARDTFQELEQNSVGTKKIAVLRADVDNLGKAFISGFEMENEGEKYVTLSRTATFSRKMSLYFKKHINTLLQNGKNYIVEKAEGPREAVVVYSGGDDLFIVGSWDDIIGFALDLYHSFKRYTQSSLSFSAGIGVFDGKFPIANMAAVTGELEDCAKTMEGKNAITLFDKENTYSWKTFHEKVINEKYHTLNEFFKNRKDKGRSFLYHLLRLLREMEENGEKINLARLAYVLGRIEPENKSDKAEKERMHLFSERIYHWMKHAEDRKQAITAIYLYAYKTREGEIW